MSERGRQVVGWARLLASLRNSQRIKVGRDSKGAVVTSVETSWKKNQQMTLGKLLGAACKCVAMHVHCSYDASIEQPHAYSIKDKATTKHSKSSSWLKVLRLWPWR